MFVYKSIIPKLHIFEITLMYKHLINVKAKVHKLNVKN